MTLMGWIKRLLTARWLPWLIAALTLIVAFVYEILKPIWLSELSNPSQVVIWLFALVLILSGYFLLGRWQELVEQNESLRQQLAKGELLVDQLSKRLEGIFNVSQLFIEACDENEVLLPVLKTIVELTSVNGVAYVPLDEHGQPQTAIRQGDLPYQAMDAWVEYLATPAVRSRCGQCEIKEDLTKPTDCPLLKGPFKDSIAALCLPVRRGESEFGVITLFLEETREFDAWTRAFLRALVDETALGLEGIRFRQKELTALRQLREVRQKTDLSGTLTEFLVNVMQVLEADYASLSIRRPGEKEISLSLGECPDQAKHFINNILQGAYSSGEALILGEVAGDSNSNIGLHSLLVAPVKQDENLVVGALLVANRRIQRFQNRQLSLLQTFAGQAALVVQNANLVADIEYQAMMEERKRLAREVHDGVAQTLGFLKLQTAQIRNYLERKDHLRAQQQLELIYSALADAYQDVRQVIDGLRISTTDYNPAGWLKDIAKDFHELSGIPVDVQEIEVQTEFAPEIHAQLIRVVQEALSNVRKHAHAKHTWVTCREEQENLVIEVRDDGEGFLEDAVPGASKHGLRGMQERAGLIGAEIELVSHPNEGTTVRLVLPLKAIGEVKV